MKEEEKSKGKERKKRKKGERTKGQILLGVSSSLLGVPIPVFRRSTSFVFLPFDSFPKISSDKFCGAVQEVREALFRCNRVFVERSLRPLSGSHLVSLSLAHHSLSPAVLWKFSLTIPTCERHLTHHPRTENSSWSGQDRSKHRRNPLLHASFPACS